jgi:glutamate racemase
MKLEARLELKYEIGKKRRERIKERIEEALQELKDDGLIRDYLAAGNTFSIIYVKETYKVCSISVEEIRDKNPKWEDLSSIKRRILKAIAAKERGWFLKRF